MYVVSVLSQRQWLEQFIEIYHSEPCLWDLSAQEYHDRELRLAAIERLVEHSRLVEPNADKDYVQRKINSLRGNYRKELRKRERAARGGGGDGSGGVGGQKLWYFDRLTFLPDQDCRQRVVASVEHDGHDEDVGNNVEVTMVELRPERRTSMAWRYFTDLKDDSRARCNFCGKLLSYKGGGPFNLIRHLKKRHPTFTIENYSFVETVDATMVYQEDPDYTPTTSKRAVKTAKATPATVPPKKIKPHVMKHKKTEKLNSHLLRFICKNYLPFSIVECKEFQSLVRELNAEYQIPSRKLLVNGYLNSYYNIAKDKVSKTLEDATYVSLSTDLWTSNLNENYIMVTAHFIDRSTKLKTVMLECRLCEDEPQHDALYTHIEQIIEEWKISDKIISVTTDSGNNITSAIGLSNWKHVMCFAHNLNLIVEAGLEDIRETHLKMRIIVDFFKKNDLACAQLKTIQKQLGGKELGVKQDVPTRWNSTYYMFQRFLDIQSSLILVMSINYQDHPTITDEDANILRSSCELLSYFHAITEEVSSEKKLIISEVILLVNALKNACRKFSLDESHPDPVRKMATTFLSELTERFENLEKIGVYAESTVLDPRFKRFGFENQSAFDETVEQLKESVSKVRKQKRITEQTDEKPSSQKRSISIWNAFDDELSTIIKSQNASTTGSTEMDSYLKEVLLSRQKDPLEWWEGNREKYPGLYDIVLRRFCVSPTSVPCEWIFTKAGMIMNENRRRLSGQKVAKVVFLNFNM